MNTTTSDLAERIPSELRASPRWCRWDLVQNAKGRPTKRPDCSTRSESARRPLERVLEAGPVNAATGIGFVLTGAVQAPGGGFLVALDLDACRSPTTGALEPWAREVLEHYGPTYAETTPSGEGIRVWIRSRELLENARTKATLDYARPADASPSKSVEMQVFGTGPAGYVTVSGDRLPGAPTTIAETPDLRWLRERFKLDPERGEAANAELPKGYGDPPTLTEVEKRVREHPQGAAFIAGDWRKLVHTGGDPSASAAFHKGCQLAIHAAHQHGDVAVAFLLQRTAWGRGDIDDSADPSRYARPEWVAAEVARAAAKHLPAPVASVFEPLDGTWEPDPALATKPQPDVDLLVHASEFVRTVDRDPFLVFGVLPRKGIAQFHGQPGCGKTPFALSLAVHVAAGLPTWFGHDVDHRGDVVYMIGEDESGIRNRLVAELEQHELPSDAGPLALHFTTRPGRLSDLEDVARWLEAIRTTCPRGLALLVVDTQSRNFGGGNENDTEDMARFVEHLDGISRALRCLVLLIHHEGFSGEKRGRGSSVMIGALDASYHIERPSKFGVVAECLKMKNAAEPEPLQGTLAVHTVGSDSRGRDITAVALETTAQSAASVFEALDREDPVRRLVVAVSEIDGEPTTLKALAKSAGFPNTGRGFREAVARATSLDLVERSTDKSTSGNRSTFSLTPEGLVAVQQAEEGAGTDDVDPLAGLGDLFDGDGTRDEGTAG